METPTWLEKIRLWIVNHDDSWLFTISYVTLAVVLSIWISLFWLVVVVAVHYLFEWIRHSDRLDNKRMVAAYAFWDTKLDFSLIIFALALTAYMDLILGMAGLGGATRLGLQAGARLSGWVRAMRGILLSLDDAALVARAALNRVAANTSDHEVVEATHVEPRHPWQAWTRGDRLSIGFGVTCAVLIVIAPFLTDHSYASMLQELLDDLKPLP